MSGSLEEPFIKVARAVHHYRVLKNEIHGGVDRQVRPVRIEPKGEAFEYCFYLGEVAPLDPATPLVIGDCLHNLRAALDYLALQLHVRHYRGRDIPDQAITEIGFPIRADQWKYRQGRNKGQGIPTCDWREIKRLSARDRTRIEWLQPYNRRNDKLAGVRQHLLDIHQLNIEDKHRRLHIGHIAPIAAPIMPFPAVYGYQSHPVFGVTLKSNAYVDRWTFTKPPPPEYMDMHPGVHTTIGLEYNGEKLEIIAVLGGCIMTVVNILGRYLKYFPPGDFTIEGISDVRQTVGPVP